MKRDLKKESDIHDKMIDSFFNIGLEINKIHQKDCIKGMKLLKGKSIDLIVTSPPYNIGKIYNGYNDKRPRKEYLDWMEEVAKEAKRVMKRNGSFFLNVGGKPSDPWIAIDVAQRFREHFILQNTIHWIKSIAIQKEDIGNYSFNNDIAVGHYQPVNSNRFLNGCHEYIFHFTKRGDVKLDKLAIGVEYQDKSNIKRWNGSKEGIRDRGNTWFISYPTIKESRPHPAVFPEKLPEMCIKLHGAEDNTIVLDPFMGLGTTALACLNLGVDYIGFEIDPHYIEIANEYISQSRLI